MGFCARRDLLLVTHRSCSRASRLLPLLFRSSLGPRHRWPPYWVGLGALLRLPLLPPRLGLELCLTNSSAAARDWLAWMRRGTMSTSMALAES